MGYNPKLSGIQQEKMVFGICPLSVVPIRSSASDKSEMLSQLLFGELFEVMEEKGRRWLKIRCQNDNFVGWVAAAQVKALTPREFEEYRQNFAYNLELVQAVMAEDHFLPITIGARLPNFDGLRFKMGESAYTFSGQAVFPDQIGPGNSFVLKIARRYLHAPYLWGGRSPFGLDGSGLVQVVYQMAGISLPREPQQQVMVGATVDFMEQSLAGDIAFFENRSGRIAHCGIVLPDYEVLHVHGKVRIDKIDHFGIYDVDQKKYSHRLRLIKRVLPLQRSLLPESGDKEVEKASRQPELF